MFSGASNFVNGVDLAFLIILSISLIFLLAITVVMIYFVYRYHEKRSPVATEIHGNTKLEIIWTVIPTILAMFMFYYGWKGWIPVRHAPADALVVKATARMWSFTFDYPNGKTSNELLVPQGKAVKLELKAMDINHSVFIPAFRIKQDAIPGRDNFLWFISDKPGNYDLFCTEYCGLRHSYMNAVVKVMPEAEFNKWFKDTAGLALNNKGGAAGGPPGAAGKRLYEQKGCLACHSLDGSKIVGPSFKGIYGEKVTVITAGSERTITVDDDYIKKSLQEPNADVVKGFKEGQMISYKAELNDAQIKDIIEFIKSLNATEKKE